MDFISEYKSKLGTPEDAAKLVKSGDWVEYGNGTTFAVECDKALAKRRDELFDVKFRGQIMYGPIEVAECDPSGEHFCYNAWHCSGYERKLLDKGQAYFSPMIFRNLAWYHREFLHVNVAYVCATPMDKHGNFSYALACSHLADMLDNAKTVIVEVNENLPWVYGLNGCEINIADVDMVVEGENPPVAQLGAGGAPTEVDTAVANLVVPQIPNGACLQLGIGGMPNTIAVRPQGPLRSHRDVCGRLCGYGDGRQDHRQAQAARQGPSGLRVCRRYAEAL